MRSLLRVWIHSIVYYIVVVVAYILYAFHSVKNLFRNRRRQPIREDEGKCVVVVTGADSGFGRLLVEDLLIKSRFHVLALTLTADAGKELGEYAKDHNLADRFHALKCDVTSDKDVQAAADYCEDRLLKGSSGRYMYGVVNNAGIANPGAFLWFHDVNAYQKVMDVNFFGGVRVTQRFAPMMLPDKANSRQGGGRIINITSVEGKSSTPMFSLYNASKFAVEGFSDSIRMELDPFGIDVVTIRPGGFKTNIVQTALEKFFGNYAKAPDTIRCLYGNENYKTTYLPKLAWMLDNTTGSPSLVAETIRKILCMKGRPAPSYYVGDDAHTLYKAAVDLPTSVEAVLKKIVFDFKPLGIDE